MSTVLCIATCGYSFRVAVDESPLHNLVPLAPAENNDTAASTPEGSHWSSYP